MKKTLSYPELWKQKQRELPVKGNPDAEWLKMRALLDQRLPVSATIKKPFHFKLPKWGLKVLVGVSTMAAVYVAGRLYLSKNNHEPAKPGIQQIHRDTLAPAGSGTSPAGDSVKPAAGSSTPGLTPVVRGGDAKPNNDTPKPEPRLIDSIKEPAMLNLPVHRDSAVLPMETIRLKPLRDSVSPVGLEKKDTSNNTKKPSTKKKRRKVSVFF